MRYVYKASDLKPGEGLLTSEPEATPHTPEWLHRIARDWASEFERANPGARASLVTVRLDVSVDYVPASVALPAKGKGRKA